MREKSRARLGRKFELLLGQSHEYGYFDKNLIERYICLGDLFDDEPETLGQTGPTDTPYDSTNYSPIGRFVTFGIRRHW